jgi:hypothetical protein
VERETIEAEVDFLRAENPEREGFLAAIRAYSDTLGEEQRKVLGEVLLEKSEPTGGFDEITKRREEGGWLKRSVGRMAERDRKFRESAERQRKNDAE